MRKNGLGQGNPGRESAMLAIHLNESYKLVDLKNSHLQRTQVGRPTAALATQLNYSSPGEAGFVKILSVPTTWPWRVPGISVSGSSSVRPDLVPVLAMVTRFTSRVRPTARSKLAFASFKSAKARNSTPSAVT